MRAHGSQWVSHKINFRHPGQLKKWKSWELIWSYQLNSTANLAHVPQNWQYCLACSSRTATRILIFSIAMGADYTNCMILSKKNYGIWQRTPSACWLLHFLVSIVDFGCHLISAHPLSEPSCIFGSSKRSSWSEVKSELEFFHFQQSLLIHVSCSFPWMISNELNWMIAPSSSVIFKGQ